jgi:hypothetical protein
MKTEIKELILNKETMSSTQLSELLHYDRKEINKKIRSIFAEKIYRGIISITPRPNGQVEEYYLPELESKMLVAKHDDKYLEQITQYWIDRNKPVMKTRLELAKEQVALLEDLERKELEVKELKVELDESHHWASIKKVEALTGEKYNWRLLKLKSVEHNLPQRDVFDANYGTVKSYSSELWQITYDVDISKLSH